MQMLPYAIYRVNKNLNCRIETSQRSILFRNVLTHKTPQNITLQIYIFFMHFVLSNWFGERIGNTSLLPVILWITVEFITKTTVITESLLVTFRQQLLPFSNWLPLSARCRYWDQ